MRIFLMTMKFGFSILLLLLKYSFTNPMLSINCCQLSASKFRPHYFQLILREAWKFLCLFFVISWTIFVWELLNKKKICCRQHHVKSNRFFPYLRRYANELRSIFCVALPPPALTSTPRAPIYLHRLEPAYYSYYRSWLKIFLKVQTFKKRKKNFQFFQCFKVIRPP